MAKTIKLSQLPRWLKKNLGNIPDELTNTSFLNSLGNEVSDMIVDRTRSGKGVERPNGPEKRLKGLSQGYVKQRQRMRSRLHPSTSPQKSNLTLTGDMLNSVTHTTQIGKLTITFKDTQAKQKAKYVSGQRPFMNLSNNEIDFILDFVNKKVSKELP